MIKRIAALILIVSLLSLCVLSASAEEPEAGERRGSIRILMEYDGEPMDGGALSLYRVADFLEAEYRFELVEPLRDSGLTLEDLEDNRLPAALLEAAREAGLEVITAPVRNGEAWLENLIPGIYLVFQNPEDACRGFLPIEPFLITLPREEEGALIYQIEARPKVSPEPEPTDPTEPTEPGVPEIPQTGQLNWPVPLLAVGGLTLLLLGWYLVFGGRKDDYET